MGLPNTVLVPLAGRRVALCLNCGELDEFQRRRGGALSSLCRRLMTGGWRVDDVLDALFLGLVGAGAGAAEARDIVDGVARQPLRASGAVTAAMAVIGGAFVGVPERGGNEENRPGPERPVDFARFRAKFLEFQISPAEVGRMSLGELLSTFDALGKKGGDAPTDEEYDEIIGALRALNDPSVRVH